MAPARRGRRRVAPTHRSYHRLEQWNRALGSPARRPRMRQTPKERRLPGAKRRECRDGFSKGTVCIGSRRPSVLRDNDLPPVVVPRSMLARPALGLVSMSSENVRLTGPRKYPLSQNIQSRVVGSRLRLFLPDWRTFGQDVEAHSVSVDAELTGHRSQ